MSLPEPLEHLTALFAKFPGVGRKSARRMAFYLLRRSPGFTRELADAMKEVRERLHPCPKCGNLTEQEVCEICRDPLRDGAELCVVETVEDLISIEQAGVFQGKYFVLGGRISPLEDEELPEGALERLRSRIDEWQTKEVIIATNPKVEGDLTLFAVMEALANEPVRVTRLSYGLPVGGSIGFADRVTLHAAMESRAEVSRRQGPRA
ncbi:MAG: recombination mediator RecR [Synergistales bacterium]|nr:recombination mediator RecR [Synergistales bacterium]